MIDCSSPLKDLVNFYVSLVYTLMVLRGPLKAENLIRFSHFCTKFENILLNTFNNTIL